LTSQLKYFFSIALFFSSNTLCADENEQNQETTWSYETESPEPDASDIVAPMVSFILPGAGQWMRGQVFSGTLYSGVALAGLSYAEHSRTEIGHKKIDDTEISQKGFAQRKYMLGLQTYQASGGMSLYHTFRSAVWQRQKFGQYAFLTRSETPVQLMTAPFDFQYLKRPSTYIPLAIGGLASWYLASHPPKGYTKSRLQREDPMFATAFSFNAGAHEEAMFRGWIMPVIYDKGLSGPWVNVTQATLFALAHLGSTNIPLPQFFLGLHLGNVTLKNQWTLSEAVFIHVWWDIIAFLSSYSYEKTNQDQVGTSNQEKAFRRPVPLILPPIQVFF